MNLSGKHGMDTITQLHIQTLDEGSSLQKLETIEHAQRMKLQPEASAAKQVPKKKLLLVKQAGEKG